MSIVKVGSYSLKFTREDDSYDTSSGPRQLSKSFRWGDVESISFWTYRPTENEFWIGGTGSIRLTLSGTFALITVGGDPVATWTQNTIEKSDFYRGSNDKEITTMTWYCEGNQANGGDRLYIDGFTVMLKEGPCMGTVLVSAVTIIALVAVGVKARYHKNIT